MVDIGTELRFIGEPHPDTGELRHLGDTDVEPAADCVRAPLAIGTIGVVKAHVPAEVDGAGTKDADCTVLAFPQYGVGFDANNKPMVQTRERLISFENHQLAEWFEPVADAALTPVEGA